MTVCENNVKNCMGNIIYEQCSHTHAQFYICLKKTHNEIACFYVSVEY